MTIEALFAHFLSRAEWVKPGRTPDLVEHGDPEREVTKIGVGWSACTANLCAAAHAGCDLFITHEPCFRDYWQPQWKLRETAWGRRRLEILEASGMGLFALHDTWDVWPEFGIHDSWAQALGVDRRIASEWPHQRVRVSLYQTDPMPLDGFAARVAAAVEPFGQHGVIVHGEPDRRIERVAIGTGCCLPERNMLDRGADVLIHALDGSRQTVTRLPLLDLGAAIIEVEHSVAEMPGMANMVRYLNQTFPALQAVFFAEETPSRIVQARKPV